MDAAKPLEPDRLVLLGQLQLSGGDEAKALATYERAYSEVSRLTLLNSNLVYLLARRGTDLERATELARAATEDEASPAYAAHALGYVYMKSGNLAASLWQLRYATEHANPAKAEYFYHLSQVLFNLGRSEEALPPLERALEINPRFTEALKMLTELRTVESS